jgi:hypothetical protein
MSSIPFRIAHTDPLSVDEVQGVARLDADALVLEYRMVDGVLGKAKSEAREVSLNLSDLESVNHRRGWFSDTVTITTRRISILESVPGARGPELALRAGASTGRRLSQWRPQFACSLRTGIWRICDAAQQADAADVAPGEAWRRGKGME